MDVDLDQIDKLDRFFSELEIMPSNAKAYLLEMGSEEFFFQDQLAAAESIHLHIKVEDTEMLPHAEIIKKGGEPQNMKDGYIKYSFTGGLNYIFSSIPVSQEEKSGIADYSFPHLDHIGIDIRDEGEQSYKTFNKIPSLASSKGWPSKKQGGDGKNVYCCHVQVSEKYWVYPANGVYLEFAFGKLLLNNEVFGCDLRPADPILKMEESITPSCCGPLMSVKSGFQVRQKVANMNR